VELGADRGLRADLGAKLLHDTFHLRGIYRDHAVPASIDIAAGFLLVLAAQPAELARALAGGTLQRQSITSHLRRCREAAARSCSSGVE